MAPDLSTSILVVNAHSATTLIVRTLLRQIGFADVDDTNSGADALNKMRVKRYELVISEWHLEPMTGNDLLREMRGDPALKRTPFIVIGESDPENVIAAKKAGANIYVVKPFDAQTLKAKIEAVFATRTAPLQERQQALATTEFPQSSEDAVAPPKKFPGRFTSSS